jgi:hypothetical protein
LNHNGDGGGDEEDLEKRLKSNHLLARATLRETMAVEKQDARK